MSLPKAPGAGAPRSQDVADEWSPDESSGEENTPDSGRERNGVMTNDKKTPAADVSENADTGDDHYDSSEDEDYDDGEYDDGDYDDEDYDDEDAEVLNTYKNLLFRRVDLVGDYAGNELFIIEGDSLLLKCFSDSKLDFDTGLQLLHAAYNVERFLHQLLQRKCNFHIVFLSSTKELCIPPTAKPQDAPKYFLARAAIIRHLRTNVVNANPGIAVNTFASHESPAFEKYLKATSPYFLMAHDGSAPTKHGDVNRDVESIDQRLVLRDTIVHFIKRGYNVALINGIEIRDTKVMAMVLERPNRLRNGLKHVKASEGDNDIQEADVLPEMNMLRESNISLTERQLLSVIVVGRLLRDPPAGMPFGTVQDFCSLFLRHQALLAHTPLSSRRLEVRDPPETTWILILALASQAELVLQSSDWERLDATPCDVIDFIDGRMLLHMAEISVELDGAATKTYGELLEGLQRFFDTELHPADAGPQSGRTPSGAETPVNGEMKLAVLPFSNPIFDKHLESVHIQADPRSAEQLSPAAHRVAQEVTHWHNAKKPLVPKAAQITMTEKQKFFAERRNQWFMAEMQRYAASLTNALGRSLEPETIIVGSSKASLAPGTAAALTESPHDSDSTDSAQVASKGKPQPKKGGGGKNAAKAAEKAARLNQATVASVKKTEAIGDKAVNAWQEKCKGFEADTNPRARYRKTKDYITNLQASWIDVTGAEIELYMLSSLLHVWIDKCRRKERQTELAALIWSHARSISTRSSATKETSTSAQLTVQTLGLPAISQASDKLPQRRLAFTFALPSKVESLSINQDLQEFQLQFSGPYMDRSFDSAPDNRVDFRPDGWQRAVLDSIDRNESTFVVAPTSAGKTFISFYAMRKILDADNDGILVYVAPTKALVNQIAAEVIARYSKKFKYGGKSVWAIHTRDYRVNNPTGCQILVTVPHVLQIMLLAPTNANSWSTRVKRIIFDEVHSIGQAEDGVVWEQLLLLAPCPVTALSATVGNSKAFSDWLASTQRAIGNDLVTVHHNQRYSDLRKYYYVPPKRFVFAGLPDTAAFGTLGLEHANGLNRVHPVAALVDKTRGIPDDLALEPLDCLELWRALVKYETKEYPVPKELDPKKALPSVFHKVHILKWEQELKAVLTAWISDDASPCDKVIAELEQEFRDEKREPIQATKESVSKTPSGTAPSANDLPGSSLAMLCRLHEHDALPAILFSYDRGMCEDIGQALLEQLEKAEFKQQKSGDKWTRTLERFEEWKKIQEKQAAKKPKASTKKGSKGDDDEKTSKLEQTRDAGGNEASIWDKFDPDAPMEGYHFADHSKVQVSEMETYTRQLRRRELEPWLISALHRGIGIHHAGQNRKYRQVVEILFRKGFLRVVIATGTLALGINMPAKTVVFSGDSVFLTALNYRQCAGRAGRRGFDLLGNVVFQGVSREKVCRLISSRLPDLNGHFPITTTLVLRLFSLLSESKNSKYAVSAIGALLEQPRMYMGGPSFKDQTMHHLRFSIEYLRRQYLLSANGTPLNFAGMVSHLYFTENSSFAFHALLKEGYFHELCEGIKKNEKVTLETLMLVMAHLFSRIYCRQADLEYREKVVKPSSSIVFLPPLPQKAASILHRHNEQTLEVYRKYADTFASQHITIADTKLPLSGMTAGNEDGSSISTVHSLPSTRVRSAFVALSGRGDDFDSISDLCQNTRDGIFLEEAVIPYMQIDTEQPLNAWLLDFYKHGDVKTLEKANKIRKADVWFLLNDFSLVLATIIASLMNFMKLKEGTDLDMLDIMGNLDAHEEAEDEKVAASEEQSEMSGPSVADSAIALPDRPKVVTKKKAGKVDSWEDLADEEEAVLDTEATDVQNATKANGTVEGAAWEGGNEGLRQVLKAFTKLHAEFSIKFRAMWA